MCLKAFIVTGLEPTVIKAGNWFVISLEKGLAGPPSATVG